MPGKRELAQTAQEIIEAQSGFEIRIGEELIRESLSAEEPALVGREVLAFIPGDKFDDLLRDLSEARIAAYDRRSKVLVMRDPDGVMTVGD